MEGSATGTKTRTKLSVGTKIAVAIGLMLAAGAVAYLILPGELSKHAVSEGTKAPPPKK